MMEEVIITPFLLGLSVGIYCFAWCLPFVAPFLVSQARKTKEDFLVVFKFILGRFFGYLIFGAVFGYLGERLDNFTLNLILMASLMLLSLVLIFHALGLSRAKIFSFCSKFRKLNPKLPLLMGFLMGVNICPPFLMSLTYVFTLHSVFKGIVYFLMFFLGTSLYFLPMGFLGLLNEKKEFQTVGKISAIVVGIFFLAYSLYHISKGLLIIHL